MVTPRMSHLRRPEWLDDYLEGNPMGTFLSHVDERGYGRSDRDRLRREMDEIQGFYQSQLSTMARRGMAPTGTWNDFLGNFDFDRHLSSMPTPYTGNYTPRVRHLY